MKTFEFKTADAHFLVDLEHIQVISALEYKEEPFTGSAYIESGRSEGEFSLTLAFRERPLVTSHAGMRQEQHWKLAVPLAKKHKLATGSDNGYNYGIPPGKGMKTLAKLLNELPDPYARGRAFKAEYARLVKAWKACKNAARTLEVA